MPAAWSDDQRQQAVQAQLGRGTSQAAINGFLANNPDDYQRLESAFKPNAPPPPPPPQQQQQQQAPPPSPQAAPKPPVVSPKPAPMGGASGGASTPTDAPMAGLTSLSGQTTTLPPSTASSGAPMLGAPAPEVAGLAQESSGSLRGNLGNRLYPQESMVLAGLKRAY